MAREVVTKKDFTDGLDRPAKPGTAQTTKDDFTDRLLKYIPAEVVGVFLAVDSLLKSDLISIPKETVNWVVFLFLLIMTPIYLFRVLRVKKYPQLVISTLSFAVWVFTLGGPFTLFSWYNPIYGAILLPLYTLAVATYEA